jgi:predicted RNA-binding Zn ribbon-like protein
MSRVPHDPTPDARKPAERAVLCLDFANTLHWHASASPRETLHRYEDFLAWAAGRGLLSRNRADSLARRAGREPEAADAVHRRATALREAIYRVFAARLSDRAPARDDVRLLNDEVQRALPHYRIEFRGGCALWNLAAEGSELDLPLWPIAHSAAELLLSRELGSRVGRCADPDGCGWLFLDLSKNRSRRWCSIQECGNRAKQRRLQARRKRAR